MKKPRRVANAKKPAKPRVVVRGADAADRESMTRVRDAMERLSPDVRATVDSLLRMGLRPGTAENILDSTAAKKARVEILLPERPPRVVLPGRPTKKGVSKLSTELANRICEYLQRGASLSLTASWVGVTPHMLTDWLRKKGEPYQTFQDAVRASLAYAEYMMINAIVIGAYTADAHIAIKWLAMRYPHKYQINPQQPPGVTVNFDFASVLRQVTEENKPILERRIKLAEARQQGLPEPVVIEGEKIEDTEDKKKVL